MFVYSLVKKLNLTACLLSYIFIIERVAGPETNRERSPRTLFTGRQVQQSKGRLQEALWTVSSRFTAKAIVNFMQTFKIEKEELYNNNNYLLLLRKSYMTP